MCALVLHVKTTTYRATYHMTVVHIQPYKDGFGALMRTFARIYFTFCAVLSLYSIVLRIRLTDEGVIEEPHQQHANNLF